MYKTVGSSTFAARLQLAAVLNGFSARGATAYVPPEERLYGGGPNSVRGFSQNLLGPVVYIVDTFAVSSTVIDGNPTQLFRATDKSRVLQYSPTGGNTLIVASAEWRYRLPSFGGRVQLATFVDAGPGVESPAAELHLLRSPRDAGRRRARALADRAAARGRRVQRLCVHDRLRVLRRERQRASMREPGQSRSRTGIVGTGQTCDPTFTPKASESVLSKLTFNFSIGQAF